MTAVVEARGIRRRLGVREVLRGVDLLVPAGVCHGIAGRNGAGKTTLLRVLATALRPEGGRLALFGAEGRRGLDRARARIGAVFHGSFLVGSLTVEENLDFYARLYRVPERAARIRALLERLGLFDRRGELARNLSRGLLQRADLARALLHEPGLLLLDEPFAGLDAAAASFLEEVLRERREAGAAVVLVSHDAERLSRLCARVSVLENGRVGYEGAPEAGPLAAAPGA